jgi:hypothetical protein
VCKLSRPTCPFFSGPLPHRDRKPAQVGVRHQPDLPARQFQYSALLIGEYDGANPAAERKARAGRGVDPRNVRRNMDITDAPIQDGPRSAEQQAVIYAADGERIAAAVEAERAVAGRPPMIQPPL